MGALNSSQQLPTACTQHPGAGPQLRRIHPNTDTMPALCIPQLLETLEATRQAAERAAQAFQDDTRGRVNHDDDVELRPNPTGPPAENAPIVSTHNIVPEIAAATPVIEVLRPQSVEGGDGAAEGVVGGGVRRAAPRPRPPPPKPDDSVLDEGDAAIPARASAPGGGGLFSSMVHKASVLAINRGEQDRLLFDLSAIIMIMLWMPHFDALEHQCCRMPVTECWPCLYIFLHPILLLLLV